jgi:hypothetical protein
LEPPHGSGLPKAGRKNHEAENEIVAAKCGELVSEHENVASECKFLAAECEILATKRKNLTAKRRQLTAEHKFLSSERVQRTTEAQISVVRAPK